MKPVKDGMTAGSAVKLLFYTLIFDIIIALFLTTMKFGGGFLINFFFSQGIGLSCCACVLQAQIDPHFLFNTLPNVLNLPESLTVSRSYAHLFKQM